MNWLKTKKTKVAERTLKFIDKDIITVIKYKDNIFLEKTNKNYYVPLYVWEQFEDFIKEATK